MKAYYNLGPNLVCMGWSVHECEGSLLIFLGMAPIVWKGFGVLAWDSWMGDWAGVGGGVWLRVKNSG